MDGLAHIYDRSLRFELVLLLIVVEDQLEQVRLRVDHLRGRLGLLGCVKLLLEMDRPGDAFGNRVALGRHFVALKLDCGQLLPDDVFERQVSLECSFSFFF